MSVSSVNASTSGLAHSMQMQQMQQRRQETPLKEQINGMSEEDKSEFNSKIESFSKDQMMYFKSMMQENKGEISKMSQEDASTAIFELMDEVGSVDSLGKVEGISILDVLETEAPPPPSGMPPPPGQDAQDPLASLTEENMDEFIGMLNSMTNEQKQEFGFSLMESKDELATLDSKESAEMVMSLLQDASTYITNASTQNAMSNFTRDGSFLDIYS